MWKRVAARVEVRGNACHGLLGLLTRSALTGSGVDRAGSLTGSGVDRAGSGIDRVGSNIRVGR